MDRHPGGIGCAHQRMVSIRPDCRRECRRRLGQGGNSFCETGWHFSSALPCCDAAGHDHGSAGAESSPGLRAPTTGKERLVRRRLGDRGTSVASDSARLFGEFHQTISLNSRQTCESFRCSSSTTSALTLPCSPRFRSTLPCSPRFRSTLPNSVRVQFSPTLP